MTQPPQVLGRYALHGELAAGGMATLHLARALGAVGFSRPVAIKRLHPQLAKDPMFVAMFVDEARLAARVRHPNVVPTLDVVSANGELYIVMEYIHGESLSRLLASVAQKKQRVANGIVGAVMLGVLEGLHAAHEAKGERNEPLGIVHRDVSPQNVLVGVDGVARVVDFGIAKAAGRVQTTADFRLKGKMAYMAPEQIDGSEVTRRADVWAAAVVLWELITARRLFVAETPAAYTKLVLDAPIAPPSSVCDIPTAVDYVVMRGLERDPAKRYATAREMAYALEEALPPATARVVGEWVEATAQHALEERSAHIHEMESGEPPRDQLSVRSQLAEIALVNAATEIQTSPPISSPTAGMDEITGAAPGRPVRASNDLAMPTPTPSFGKDAHVPSTPPPALAPSAPPPPLASAASAPPPPFTASDAASARETSARRRVSIGLSLAAIFLVVSGVLLWLASRAQGRVTNTTSATTSVSAPLAATTPSATPGATELGAAQRDQVSSTVVQTPTTAAASTSAKPSATAQRGKQTNAGAATHDPLELNRRK